MRSCTAGSIAQTACQHAVLITILLARISAPSDPVLDGHSAKAFARSTTEKVGFVQETEGTCEPEVPTEAISVLGPVSRCPRSVSTLKRVLWKSLWRQDLQIASSGCGSVREYPPRRRAASANFLRTAAEIVPLRDAEARAGEQTFARPERRVRGSQARETGRISHRRQNQCLLRGHGLARQLRRMTRYQYEKIPKSSLGAVFLLERDEPLRSERICQKNPRSLNKRGHSESEAEQCRAFDSAVSLSKPLRHGGCSSLHRDLLSLTQPYRRSRPAHPQRSEARGWIGDGLLQHSWRPQTTTSRGSLAWIAGRCL